MKTIAVLAAGFAVALCSCSSNEATPSPALTDSAMTSEYLETVRHMKVDDVAAGPAAAQTTVLGIANIYCDLLRSAVRDGFISTRADYAGNADWIRGTRSVLAAAADPVLTTGQVFRGLQVSAKYKCAEFAPMLELFEAVNGIN